MSRDPYEPYNEYNMSEAEFRYTLFKRLDRIIELLERRLPPEPIRYHFTAPDPPSQDKESS